VVVDLGLAVLRLALVLPVFGIGATFGQHVYIAIIFTLVYLVRGYMLRQPFEHL
jgi:hypothetical protein